jgi:hypothetical protein
MHQRNDSDDAFFLLTHSLTLCKDKQTDSSLFHANVTSQLILQKDKTMRSKISQSKIFWNLNLDKVKLIYNELGY